MTFPSGEHGNTLRRRNYAKGRKFADRAYLPWTTEELEMILAHAIPDRDLAKQIRRSVQSIQVKRCRMAQSAKA